MGDLAGIGLNHGSIGFVMLNGSSPTSRGNFRLGVHRQAARHWTNRSPQLPTLLKLPSELPLNRSHL